MDQPAEKAEVPMAGDVGMLTSKPVIDTYDALVSANTGLNWTGKSLGILERKEPNL